ncbi:MAG: GNAT family N-acetyltransferase [Prevotellaceae bacterium]|nr:GNAT family N-acetyltransferase [Prevotellaceae bacterium]
MELAPIIKNEYVKVVELWEASVRATHHFLKESDILLFKDLIFNKYLDSVSLFAVRDCCGKILGFMGVSDDNMEMLFVHPDAMGKGIGKSLVNYAISELGVKKVSVNEQNEQALAFYLKMGFNVIARSATDQQGKPYPLLHLSKS